MARALIVGCGCRGRLLADALAAEGWAVRGTARSATGAAEIEVAGFESALADPRLPGTILEHVGDVAVVVHLLGSAAGGEEALEAVHGSRLESLLAKLVDTPVRGFVYEATGSAGPARLGGGRDLVTEAGERWRIPVSFIDADPSAGHGAWAGAAATAVRACLTA